MSIALALSGALAMGSCTDQWDDHYQETQQGEGSLWQAIAANSDLSNFKAVLDATGYEKILSSSQVFTIFAPINSTFTTEMRDSVINLYKEQKTAGVKDKRNQAIVEFVQNHIALYNYSVASTTSDSIVMMNGKYIQLKGDSFAGQKFVTSNVATNNGVLFSLDNTAAYSLNIYEYLGRDEELDSVYQFLKNYEVDYFLPNQSVPGEIIDGVTHYLDSVTTLYNDIFYSYDAMIDSEDSTYWMLAPTNETWREQLEQNEKYFVYRKNFSLRDSLSYLLPRAEIIAGSFFNMSENTERALKDSAMSTLAAPGSLREAYWGNKNLKYFQFDKPYEPGGIFCNTEDIKCSNGIVKKALEWNVDRRQTFVRNIVMEGERYSLSLDSVDSKSTARINDYVTVENGNEYHDKISGNRFVTIEPTGTINTSSVWNVTQVLSNMKYKVYFVAVPAEAGNANASESQMLPSRFDATIYYTDADGKEKYFEKVKKLEVAAHKIDSVLIGEYTFPTCTWAMPKPEVKVKIESNVSNKEVRDGLYTKTLRMDCILFVPVLDEE